MQAISPNPTTSGTATNATLDFKNTGPATASNVTLVTEVLNPAGAVVGTQSLSQVPDSGRLPLPPTCLP